MKFISPIGRKKQSSGNRKPEYPDLVLAVWRDDLGQLKKLAKEPGVLDPDGRTAANKDFVQAVARENVRLAVDQIPEQSRVLREMKANGAIDVVGAVYDITSGKVEFLPTI